MKSSRNIIALFLAVTFLFSSLGLTVSSMVCLESGKELVSFRLIEDCCAQKDLESDKDCCGDEEGQFFSSKDQAVLTKAECCDLKNFSLNLSNFQNSNKLVLEQPAVLQTYFSSVSGILSSVKKLAFQSSDLPPPFHGRILLNFISTLLI